MPEDTDIKAGDNKIDSSIKETAVEASPAPAKTKDDVKAHLDKGNIHLLLQDPDTYATVLLTICLIMYGDETFKVDSLVLYQWLKEDFGTELCEENESKLTAIIISLVTDYFYTDIDVFKSICKTLTSGDPGAYDEDMFDDAPTAPEILWGIYEVSLVSEEAVANMQNFTKPVEMYIDATLAADVKYSENDDDPVIPEQIIGENVKELETQLKMIGIQEVPKFPIFDIGNDDDQQE